MNPNGSIPNPEGDDDESDHDGENLVLNHDVPSGEGNQGEMEFGMEATTRIEGLVDWLEDNKGVVDLFVKHGLEYTVMDDILSLFEAPCRSWKIVVSYISRATSLAGKVQNYPICPGHSCFATLGRNIPRIANCSSCGKSRPEARSASTPTLSYLPLVPRIATLIREKETCDQLYVYRHTRESNESIISDYFDGAAYKRLVDRYSEEGMKWDIFLAVSADGFQPYRNKQYDIWSVIGVLYNLSPSLRYATKNFVPLMYIPGPKEPKDLESFLIPLLNEILDVHANDGIEMTFYDGETRKVRIHMIWFQGDTPAVSKAAGLCGHKSRHPCRSCRIRGVYVASKKGYYFPSRKPTSSAISDTQAILYDPTQLPDRSVTSTNDAFRRLESSRNATQRTANATDTGIKRRSVLLDVPNFVPYKSFPHDTMHLLYNVQRELLDLFTGDIEDVFALEPFSIEIIDKEIMDAGHTISGQLIQRRGLRELANGSPGKLLTIGLSEFRFV